MPPKNSSSVTTQVELISLLIIEKKWVFYLIKPTDFTQCVKIEEMQDFCIISGEI